MTAETRPEQRFDWLPLVWVLLFFAWLFGVPLLFLRAVFAMPFTGMASAAEVARRDSMVMWTEIVAVALPLVGVLLAAVTRRKVPAVVFGIALFLSVSVVGYERTLNARHHPPPEPTSDWPVCQEHSGGDNECPGG
ncbi:hypothetical protein V5P93_005038 [Actinokineospora auranticolor]|uniref:Uncharacterized protein n=1 Tax=Actinokineospora auranticolor TaxID=155976 RepID=A0A2S6GK17_9PSEU|nr:hypothetical protein [Actinokineospora auranticolor]PPK65567.1 hypothetical protein CLV40_11351 [Actinokineospora auranticolor]